MFYVVLIICFLIFIFLAVKYRGFRYFAIISIVAVAGYIFYLYESDRREEALSKTRIKKEEVELFDARLSLGTLGKLTARLKNNSAQYTLKGLTLRIQVLDCVKKDCEIIGQTDHNYWSKVPPGQVRGIDEYVSFSNLPQIRGEWTWNCEILDIRGAEVKQQ